MPEWTSLTQAQAALRSGALSAVELCNYFLDRIDGASQLNAFISIDREGALRQADAIDGRRREQHALGALAGIPIAHKDIFCTAGLRTTCASRILADFTAPYDATVVQKLKDCDTVMLGKTNMDEFAMGSSSEHSHFGSVKNPWDPARVPGGSSGGSAAAVAAGLALAATGTDTGGSVRQPAALCGITGIKPSYGRVSRFGIVAFASSLDQAGVFAATARDAAVMLDAICGHDPSDSTSLDIAPPHCQRSLDESVAGLRIGVPEEYFTAGLDAQVGDAVERAVAAFEALGAKRVRLSLPNAQAAIPCYYVIAPAEASSNLSRFDGVRYGYRSASADSLEQLYKRTRSEGFGYEVQRRILIGTYVLSHGYYDAYYLQAQRIRRLIADDFAQAFEKCNLIMGPTTPTSAFHIGEKTADPVQMYLNDIYTASVNLAGLPAMSIPAGLDRQGLPVGLQIIAPYLQEERLLQAAHQFQLHTRHHLNRPGQSS